MEMKHGSERSDNGENQISIFRNVPVEVGYMHLVAATLVSSLKWEESEASDYMLSSQLNTNIMINLIESIFIKFYGILSVHDKVVCLLESAELIKV